ncbi:MAG TPA: glycoside hydrolase family 15 protein [Actinomycetota bacterium]|nr:glycoside hydrolase family 15 protein [Actinomycetota bacterium]
MASRIEDYAIVGDTHTAALISKQGSVDWLCLPRFDSGACFAALLGTEDHGRWSLAPAGGVQRTTRRYRDETLVLETTHETNDGVVRVIDFMPPRGEEADLFRVVEGLDGAVPMHMDLRIRFDYGSIMPWVRRTAGGLRAVAGPDAVELWSDVDLKSEDFVTTADFVVRPKHTYSFSMAWHPSTEPRHPPLDHRWALFHTEEWWTRWASDGTYRGEWREAVMRSLLTLKALTYAPTGGIVAAATTSLPETLGGVRNWDYRYCWLRDATFTLYSLLEAGFHAEARAWRDWLVRAVAGRPDELQIMYGVAGERRLTEFELDWLPGYEGATPVRIGNAATRQLQLDVYGEVVDLLHTAAGAGMEHEESVWRVERAVVEFLEGAWDQPDEGIWEVRGPRRHFTHSKVMAWVAFDRAIRTAEGLQLEGPVDRWKRVRHEIHAEVCREGYDADLGTFVQSYGSDRLDASLLKIPLVGFLPASDDRVQGTIRAVQDGLSADGFVARYRNDPEVEGLPGREGAFLACTFWLADCLALSGRPDEARAIFERLLAIRNDVGLLSEEYDVSTGRMTGNFPQAFSHVSLIDTARNLSGGRSMRRRDESDGLGTPDIGVGPLEADGVNVDP